MKTHHRPGRFSCRPSLAHVSKEQHIEVRSGKKDQNNAIYLAVRVATADAAAASGEWWRRWRRAAMPNHYFPFLFSFHPRPLGDPVMCFSAEKWTRNPRYARIKSISCNKVLQSKVNLISTSSRYASNESCCCRCRHLADNWVMTFLKGQTYMHATEFFLETYVNLMLLRWYEVWRNISWKP